MPRMRRNGCSRTSSTLAMLSFRSRIPACMSVIHCPCVIGMTHDHLIQIVKCFCYQPWSISPFSAFFTSRAWFTVFLACQVGLRLDVRTGFTAIQIPSISMDAIPAFQIIATLWCELHSCLAMAEGCDPLVVTTRSG